MFRIVLKRSTIIILLLLLLLIPAALTVQAQTAVAANDTYTTEPNVPFVRNAAAGVLQNDTGFSPLTHRIESYDVRSAQGGTVLVNPDGSFSYEPPVGFVGFDTFSYTVRAPQGAQTATVQINVTGNVIWFVNDDAPAGGNGTYARPFNSFASLNSASDVDAQADRIFVFNGAYSVALTLENNQHLIGEAAGLTLINSGLIIPAGTRPTLTSASGAVITLASNNTVSHVNIQADAEHAIAANTITNATISNVPITTGTNGGGFNLTNVSGTVAITDSPINGEVELNRAMFALTNSSANVTVNNSPINSSGSGFMAYLVSNTGTLTFNSTSDIEGTAGKGMLIGGLGSAAVITFAGVELSTDQGNAIELTGNHANSVVNFEEGIILTATPTNAAAFYADSGKIKIAGTANTLTASDGPALVMQTVELTQNATFSTITSTSSHVQGIRVTNPVGNNDITVTGATTVTSSTGNAIEVTHTAASGFHLTMASLTASTTSGIGISASNTAVTVTANTSTLNATGGAAISGTNAALNLAFATLTSSNAANGIILTNVSGTINATGGTLGSTDGANNHVVSINNSSVSFTYAGNISKSNAGRLISIDGLSSPGAATFSGTNTGSNASAGVYINNSARTVTFGTLNLGLSGARFATTPITLSANTGAVNLGLVSIYTNAATGLNISYANASPGQVSTAANSILDVSGAAAALVVNPTNGPQPLTLNFTSITNSGAGTHGIDINNASGTLNVSTIATFGAKTTAGVDITNSSLATTFKELDITGGAIGVNLTTNTGSFTITGDGNTSLNTNGAGGLITNTTSHAFNLNNVTNLTLNDLEVTNIALDAFMGTRVNGLVMDNVDVTNIGSADNHDAMDFSTLNAPNLTGTVTLDNVYFRQMSENAIYIFNYSGTLNMSVTNSEFEDNLSPNDCSGASCGGGGLLFRGEGTSNSTIVMDTITFDRLSTQTVDASLSGTGDAKLNITVQNSSFIGQSIVPDPGTITDAYADNSEVAFNLDSDAGNGDVTFLFQNNTITNHTGGSLVAHVIYIVVGEQQTMTGKVLNNTITGAPEGAGIRIEGDSGGASTNAVMTVEVSGNTVTGQNTEALFVTAASSPTGAGVATVNATILNNRFLSTPNFPSTATMRVIGRLTNTICLNVQGNWYATGNGFSAIDVSRTGTATMRLQGMAGTGDANAITWLSAQNRNQTGAAAPSPVTVNTSGTITSATCPTPP